MKFSSIRMPSAVITDSGWNCTASSGSDRCRSDITTPSSLRAVTTRSAGSVRSSTISEWLRVASVGSGSPANTSLTLCRKMQVVWQTISNLRRAARVSSSHHLRAVHQLDRAQERARLRSRLELLRGRVGVGNDPGARLDAAHALRDDGGADADASVHPPVEPE